MKKDSEVSEEELASHDLFVLGGIADNGLMKRIVKELGLSVGKNFFQWQGKTYGAADDGLFAAFPNPFNPKKTVYLVIANSALQLYRMTKRYEKMPSWALFKKDEIVKKGYVRNAYGFSLIRRRSGAVSFHRFLCDNGTWQHRSP